MWSSSSSLMWVGVDHCILARSSRRGQVDSFAWSRSAGVFKRSYVLTKQNDEDLQYYLWKDPAHDAFKVGMIYTQLPSSPVSCRN